ncbi:hypothetical protein [Rhodanobacter hydrolyticus]|uniref:Uncharacterized protein n=1 Tax=Rhodanobacter hydrolyticus TaxID=2250595 RepID=A0ABW8J639_9GAMM
MNSRGYSISTGTRARTLRQRIERQAVATTSAVIGMAIFSRGFLQNARVLPAPPWATLWVPLLLIGAYGVIRRLLSHRHP